MPERINSVRVTSLPRWTDEELVSGVECAERRLEAVWSDLAKFGGEIATRPSMQVEPEFIPNE